MEIEVGHRGELKRRNVAVGGGRRRRLLAELVAIGGSSWLLACRSASILRPLALGRWRVDRIDKPGELFTQHLALRKQVVEAGQNQSTPLEGFEFILDLVAGAPCLAEKLCELRIAAKATAFRDVLVNRVGGAAKLIRRVRSDSRTELAHKAIYAI